MRYYNILEIANTHGGSIEYVYALLNEFKSLNDKIGIKFQPFHYDLLATNKFEWYEVYKQLFFSVVEWRNVIDTAAETKDVWLDIFDEYSVKILTQNLNKICGIKFQSSVLKNRVVIDALSRIGLEKKKILLNVSGYNLNEIYEIKSFIDKRLEPKETILQVGFQDYPTKFSDSGIGKISVLSNEFSNSISFADHIDANDEESLRLPVVAVMLGASYIEKHIKHSSLETKYDYFSSIDIVRYKEYLRILRSYSKAFKSNFINEREKIYLKKSIQVPLVKSSIPAGKSIDLKSEIIFKRSEYKGLSIDELEKLNDDMNILRKNKSEDEPFILEDFKKANISTIIAVRLKSSRLPQKAILKIGNLTSIELCIKNCLKFRNVQHIIIATSNVAEDGELENYTYNPSVIFHRGHPVDVIERYIDIIEKLKIDVVIRLTGDCPYPSDEILQILLKSHFQSGADYTRAEKAAIGTNLEIINSSALKKVKEYFPNADYSEYMTYYFTNNPDYFKLNFVSLPEELISDYRLTLDYIEDLELFEKIEEYFNNLHLEYDIKDVFKYLSENPEIAQMNSNCEVTYQTKTDLIELINEKTTINKRG